MVSPLSLPHCLRKRHTHPHPRAFARAPPQPGKLSSHIFAWPALFLRLIVQESTQIPLQRGFPGHPASAVPCPCRTSSLSSLSSCTCVCLSVLMTWKGSLLCMWSVCPGGGKHCRASICLLPAGFPATRPASGSESVPAAMLRCVHESESLLSEVPPGLPQRVGDLRLGTWARCCHRSRPPMGSWKSVFVFLFFNVKCSKF